MNADGIQEYLVEGVAMREPARRYDIQRNLLSIWVDKYQSGAFNEVRPCKNVCGEIGNIFKFEMDRRSHAVSMAAISGLIPMIAIIRFIL